MGTAVLLGLDPGDFADYCAYFHVNADEHGDAWNRRAVLSVDGAAQGGAVETANAEGEIDFVVGTRFPSGGRVRMGPPGQPPVHLEFESGPLFQMRGIGYQHREWGHGAYRGALALEREDIDLSAVVPADPTQVHVQAASRVTRRQEGRADEQGVGTFETFVLGPYAPYGITGLADPAPLW